MFCFRDLPLDVLVEEMQLLDQSGMEKTTFGIRKVSGIVNASGWTISFVLSAR